MSIIEKFKMWTNKGIDKNTKTTIKQIYDRAKIMAKRGHGYYTYIKEYYPNIYSVKPSSFAVKWDVVNKFFADMGFKVENDSASFTIKWEEKAE